MHPRQIWETSKYVASTALYFRVKCKQLICDFSFSLLTYSSSFQLPFSVSHSMPCIHQICLRISVGWTGPFPVLCQKRPTANLVSRKVLTPLLGQITICILIQAVAFQAVRRQPWSVTATQRYRNNTNFQ